MNTVKPGCLSPEPHHTMASKRRKLASVKQKKSLNYQRFTIEPWIPINTTFCKSLPFSGEGVVSANIKRRTTFAIRIRPKRRDDTIPEKESDDIDEQGYVEVEISSKGAVFKYKRPGHDIEVGPSTKEGLEVGKKVSYWYSFNRNDRVLKYGKGYIMEQTTLLTKPFPFPETEGEEDPWDFIFRPDTTKEIVIKDVESIDTLTMLEDPTLSGKLLSLSQVEMQVQAGHAYCLISQADQIKLRSLADVEKKVSFYPHSLTRNWSPLVLDSSKATLSILSTNHYTMSASLPPTCRELYENVASPGVALDWPYSYPRLSDAITYSINTEGKILYKKLKEKEEKGDFQYLRVTVGLDRGSSPGVPFVLEIWPPKTASPIHNHGNTFAVIKVLYGAVNITIYNKTWDGEQSQEELMNFTAIQGDVTWISPNWFQTHKLTNESDQLFCATIQCYKYGFDDELMWPYFDYLEGKTVKEFLPDSDFEFTQMREALIQEYRHDHPESK